VTVPAHTKRVSVANLDAALDVLRERGLRLSAARRIVLEALFEAAGPLTADELADGCDLASVYRNLEQLEEAGVVRHLHVGHGPGLYLPTGRSVELIVCERCGARAEIDPGVAAGVRTAVCDATGFTPRFDHFPLAGLCPRCAEQRKDQTDVWTR